MGAGAVGCGDDEPATGPASATGRASKAESPSGSITAKPEPASRPDDGYHPIVSIPEVSGDPVTIRHRMEDGLTFHSKGSYSFRQVARGKFDAGTDKKPKKPPE